jgi:hypothetical protein
MNIYMSRPKLGNLQEIKTLKDRSMYTYTVSRWSFKKLWEKWTNVIPLNDMFYFTVYYYYLFTYSMEQSPSLEANSKLCR